MLEPRARGIEDALGAVLFCADDFAVILRLLPFAGIAHHLIISPFLKRFPKARIKAGTKAAKLIVQKAHPAVVEKWKRKRHTSFHRNTNAAVS